MRATMVWQFTPYLIPLIISAMISFILAMFAWLRRTSGAKVFALLTLIITIWLLGYAVELAVTLLPLKILWAKIQYISIVSLPVVWFVFAAHFSNRSDWLNRRNLISLTIIPFITLTLVWTNELHGLIWQKTELLELGSLVTLDLSYGPWFWVHTLYSYILLLVGTILLTLMLARSVHIYRWQTLLLLAGIFGPWLGNLVYLMGLSPIPELDLTPFAFAFSNLAFGWGFYRFRLLDLTPIARSAVVDVMSDAVIVLDNKNRIVDINVAAERILDLSRVETIGQVDTNVLSKWPAWQKNYRHLTEGYAEITLNTSEGLQHYDLHISPLTNQNSQISGRLVVLRNVTDRKQAEEIMHLTQFSVDQAVDPIFWVAEDGRLAYVNEAACKYLDYPKNELLNLTIHDIDPNYPSEIWPSHWRSLETRGFFIVESRHRTKTGKFIPVELTFNYLEFKGTVYCYLCARDITWRRWAVQELVESEERFEQVVSSISDFIYMTEMGEGEVPNNRFISPKVETLTGYPMEKFISEWGFWRTLIHDEDREVASVQFDKLKQGQNSVVEYRMIQASGDIIWVRDSVRIQKDVARQKIIVYGVVTDITPQKEAQTTMRLAHDQALEANRFKTQLLAKVSHELRTPLGAILGFAELLEMGINGPLAPSQRESVIEIIDSAEYLSSLVNELLDQAQLDAGKLNLKVGPLNLSHLLNDTISKMEILATRKGILLTQQIASDMPATILGDANRLQQILVNLVGNAIKFTKEGKIEVEIYRSDESHWVLQVSDTGPGIPTAAQNTIFEPFQQVDNSVTREHGGSGLGLSIVKQLTVLMTGEITLESKRGQGSTFTVRLPLNPVLEIETA
jgi:PAS domain S-box-containing protein